MDQDKNQRMEGEKDQSNTMIKSVQFKMSSKTWIGGKGGMHAEDDDQVSSSWWWMDLLF